MRESDGTLDSHVLIDAKHLSFLPTDARQPIVVSKPGKLAPDAKNFPVVPHPAIALNTQLAHEHDTSAIVPSTVTRDHVLEWLQQNVPDARLQHILRVEQMSVALAYQHHLNQAQAAQAGLMHDLAKFFKPQRLLQMAQAEGLELDPVDITNPHLLHADVGAIVARDEFGVSDVAVLDAIRNHTLGRPGMSELSCVVFLADSLEPGRGDTPELTALRQLSQQNLYRAVWQTCDYSLRYLMSGSRLMHPRMVLTRNWAVNLVHQTLPGESLPDVPRPPIA